MRYTKDIAIIVPVTDPDDQTAREAVWQPGTDHPADGKALHTVRAVRGRMGTEIIQSIQRHSGQKRTGAVPVFLRIREASVG